MEGQGSATHPVTELLPGRDSLNSIGGPRAVGWRSELADLVDPSRRIFERIKRVLFSTRLDPRPPHPGGRGRSVKVGLFDST